MSVGRRAAAWDSNLPGFAFATGHQRTFDGRLATSAAMEPPLSRLCSTIRAGGSVQEAVPVARAARRRVTRTYPRPRRRSTGRRAVNIAPVWWLPVKRFTILAKVVAIALSSKSGSRRLTLRHGGKAAVVTVVRQAMVDSGTLRSGVDSDTVRSGRCGLDYH